MATCGRRLLLAGNRLNDHYMLWLLIWGHSWMWLNDDFDITVLPVDSMQLTPASLMRASSKVVCGQPLPSFSWDSTGSRMQVVADIKPSVASVVLVPTTDPDLQPIRYPHSPPSSLKYTHNNQLSKQFWVLVAMATVSDSCEFAIEFVGGYMIMPVNIKNHSFAWKRLLCYCLNSQPLLNVWIF